METRTLTNQQRGKIVQDWHNSGLTQTEFCKKNKIKQSTFKNWGPYHRALLKTQEQEKETGTNIKIEDIPGNAEMLVIPITPAFEVHIGNSKIFVPNNFKEGELKRLIQTIAA